MYILYLPCLVLTIVYTFYCFLDTAPGPNPMSAVSATMESGDYIPTGKVKICKLLSNLIFSHINSLNHVRQNMYIFHKRSVSVYYDYTRKISVHFLYLVSVICSYQLRNLCRFPNRLFFHGVVV